MSRQDKILLVDDDSLNVAILEDVLGDDFALATAGSGEEALALAVEFEPDLVLLDIMMPGMDGYETCVRLRANEALKFCKIILVSAKATVSERLKGYDAGADDYITKPFDHAELLAKVKVFLRLKFMEQMDVFKTEFLVLMGHETRTPSTQLLLLPDMLDGDCPPTREELRRIAMMIRDASQHLHGLFERGLHYCLLRAGQGEFENACFDARDILHETCAAVKPKADLLESTIAVATETEAADMESDREQARLVMQLLLEFALESSGKESRIEVRLSAGASGVVMTLACPARISDPNLVHHLLEPVQSPDVAHHTGGGVIALPLAAEVMRHLQGELSVDLDGAQNLILQARFPRTVDTSASEWTVMDERVKRAA